MAKKVVYSLLALSAVPAANANAAAVAAPAQGTQVQGEMTAADVQEVYQMLEASAEDFANVINGLQNQLNAGVNEIEDMLGQAEKFDERVDQEKLAALVQLLKDSKIDIATIDQGLDDIKNNEENQTEDNFAKVSAPAETNEYLIRLEEILKAARDAFNELNAENENILANDANQAAADELQTKLDELKDKEVADENKKGEIDEAIKNVEDQVNGFKDAADKAFEDGTATEFEPDPSKEEIEEAIQAVSDQIDAINANYDAYKEVKDAIDASTAAYNEAMDLLQTTLGGKEDYTGLLKDTQKLLTDVQQNIKLADKANEEAYAEGKSVEKKDELLGMFETDTDAILKIAQDAIAKYEAIEAAKEAVSTLQENLDKVEVKDEFLNKEELQTEKDDIQKEINDLSDAVKEAIADPEVDGSYSVEEQAAAIQQKIDDLVGKVEEAQKAADENKEAYDAVIASIGDLQQLLDDANDKVEEKTYENNDNAPVKERYTKLSEELQAQIDGFQKQADEANANGTAVEFNENFPEASKELKAAIEEYYSQPSAALNHYDEVWEQLGTVDKSMKELNDFINGMTADNTEAKAQAEELAGRIDAVKGEIADALTKEGKEHWEAMLAVNAPDAAGGPTELDEIATAIDELMDQVKADQQAYDDEQAKDARIAVSNEVRDRLDAIYDLIEEIGDELKEENKDAIGSAYDELVNQFEEIQNVDLAAQEDSYKQNKEYEDGDPEGATPGADGERNDNLEPDDVKAHSELSKIVDALKGIAEDLNNLKDGIQDAKDNVAENNAAKTTADADVDALQKELDEAIQTVADLVKDETGDPVETEFADDFEKIQGEIDDLKKEIDDAYAAEELADKLEEINGKIKDISDEIKQTVDDAKAFQANLDAIADLLDRYEEVKKEYEDAMSETFDTEDDAITSVFEADENGDAAQFYKDQLEAQQTILDLIKEDIDKLTNDAVEKKPDLMDRLDKFEEGVNQVLQDAADNREAYEGQKTAKEETQDLWNEVYTRINTTDESSIKDEWLEKLDKLQDDINAVALTISDSYKEGKSVENDDAIMDEITRIKNALNDLDAQQQEGYDEQIAKDNTAMYEAFLEAIKNTDEAFKVAVETIDGFRGVKNEGLKKVVEDIVVKYHDIFYVLPTDATEEDPYRVKIQDLKDEVREAFAKVKSPEKFDEESTYVQRANDLTTEINHKTADFIEEVQLAIDALWADIEADVTGKVDAAKAELTGAEPPYEVDADKAFEELTDKIAEAKEYAHDVYNPTVLKKLDDVLENYLVKADEIIADALNEAAKADIDPRVADADKAFKDATEKMKDNSDKLQELNDLYNETVAEAKTKEAEAYAKKELADARAEIIELLNQFTTDAASLVEEYEQEKQAAEDLAEAVEDLNKKIDDAIEKLEQVLEGEDDIEVLEDLREEVNSMKTAEEADDIEAKINTAIADAIDEEQEIINAQLEELQEAYNRFASQKIDTDGMDLDEAYAAQAEHAAKAAEMRALIEEARKALDDTATLDDVIAGEKALADLNSSLNPGADEAAQEALNDAIADLEEKAKLEGISDEVKAEFEDELSELNDKIADVKDEVENLENADFYKDKIQKEIDEIAAELDKLVEDAQAEQAKVDANNEAYADALAALGDIDEILSDAKDIIDEFGGNSNAISNLQNTYDKKRQEVEKLNSEKALTADYVVKNLDVEAVEEAALEAIDNAAISVVGKKIDDARQQLTDVMSALKEKNYAAEVWKEIQNEYGDIYKNLNGIALDNDGYENMEDNLKRIADEVARIEALAERVQTVQLGDVNHDGKITNKDYFTLLDIIASGEKPEAGTDEFVATDINGDGEINIGDAVALSNVILYGNVEGVASARAAQNVEENVTVEASKNADGTTRLAINLNNGRAYTAMQMDIVLPEGMSIVAQSAAQRAEGHDLYTGQFDGINRIVMASSKSTAFAGNSGAVVYIDIEGAGSMDQIEFQNVLFAETNAQLAEFTVGAPVTNGINSIQSDSMMSKVYNMGGRMVNAVKKGINIIKGNNGETKKVVVK